MTPVARIGALETVGMMGAFLYPLPGFSDPVSSLSHLVGAGVFTCLTPFLLWRARGNPARLISLGVFAFATVLLLSMSGVYHLLSPGTGGRLVLQRLDHGAIFVLIAGTFTPVQIILFRGPWRWAPLLFIWAAAITGVTLKSIFFNDLPEAVGLILYLGMGWFGAVSGFVLWLRHGWPFIRLMFWGGVAYSAGAVLEFLQWPTPIPGVVGAHELFHVGVLTGAALHWKFVAEFACGTLPPMLPRATVGVLPAENLINSPDGAGAVSESGSRSGPDPALPAPPSPSCPPESGGETPRTAERLA